MTEKMDQFTSARFPQGGEWKMAGLNLDCALAERDQRGNFIYAFVMGKTIKFLEYSRTCRSRRAWTPTSTPIIATPAPSNR